MDNLTKDQNEGNKTTVTDPKASSADLRSSSGNEAEKTPAPSGYNKLAKVIEQALKDKFTETNEQMLSMMTDSSPKFIWS